MSSDVVADGLFGRVAVHLGFMSFEKLVAAIAAHGALPATTDDEPRLSLGKFLVKHGDLTYAQYDLVLQQQQDILRRREQSQAERAAAEAETSEEIDVDFERDDRVDQASARTWLERSLVAAANAGATDIFVTADELPRVRQNGRLVALLQESLPAAFTAVALTTLLDAQDRADFERDGHVDFAVSLAGQRFRANIFREARGVSGVFRVLPARPPTLQELGLPLTLAGLTTFRNGIVLCTGPGGSGKSSTLAALVHLINEERAEHIVTIEDPIEVLHEPLRCVVNQREARRHATGSLRALHAALREDPDVIVIGEMRDKETVSLALTAAETGHLVLATVHTNDAVRTVGRIVSEFPPDQQPNIRAMLAESLRAVISQRLLRRKDGSGLVPALEIMINTPAVANLIRENRAHQLRSVIQTSAAQGMQTLDGALTDLAQRGIIDEADAPRTQSSLVPQSTNLGERRGSLVAFRSPVEPT